MTSYNLKSQISNLKSQISRFTPGPKSPMVLNMTVTREAGKDPVSVTSCTMKNFTLTLKGLGTDLVELGFNLLQFSAPAGAKPDVNVDLSGIHFKDRWNSSKP